jgi:hypothetical protein
VSSNPRLCPHDQPNIDRLNQEHLPKHLLKAGSALFRIHKSHDRQGNLRGAVFYSRDNAETNVYSRFNDPKGRIPEQRNESYGVMYAAIDKLVALRETVELTVSRLVVVETLEQQCLSRLYLRRDLILVDLSGAGLARIKVINDYQRRIPNTTSLVESFLRTSRSSRWNLLSFSLRPQWALRCFVRSQNGSN